MVFVCGGWGRGGGGEGRGTGGTVNSVLLCIAFK